MTAEDIRKCLNPYQEEHRISGFPAVFAKPLLTAVRFSGKMSP